MLDPSWTQVEQLISANDFSVAVIPKALLKRKNVHVDIIFPSLDLLNTGFNLSTHPECNKQLFQDLFGWKKENTIKGVILISKRAPGEKSKVGAIQRAKEICRLIKSLPEAQKIPVYAAVNVVEDNYFTPRIYGGQNGTNESWSLQFPATEPPVASSSKAETPVSFGGPLTLIVFGGEAVEATAYFLNDDEKIEPNPRFAHWKATEYKETVSRAKQVICFYGDYIVQTPDGEILLEQLASDDAQLVQLYYYRWFFGIAKSQADVEEEFSRIQMNYEGFFIVGFQ